MALDIIMMKQFFIDLNCNEVLCMQITNIKSETVIKAGY